MPHDGSDDEGGSDDADEDDEDDDDDDDSGSDSNSDDGGSGAIRIDGLRVVFTGTFEAGPRRTVEGEAEALGASVGGSVSSRTDLLVIGGLVRPFGAKEDKAHALGEWLEIWMAIRPQSRTASERTHVHAHTPPFPHSHQHTHTHTHSHQQPHAYTHTHTCTPSRTHSHRGEDRL